MTHVTKRLAPLALAFPLLACSIFGGTPTEEPASPTSETPVVLPTLAPAPSDTAPAPSPTIGALPTEAGPAEWPCYDNEFAFPFTLCYPPDAAFIPLSPSSARIDLPFAPDTNLAEKWLEILVTEGAQTCSGPQGGTDPPETISIAGPYNSLDFLIERGGDAGAGNFWEWVSYSTQWGDTCVSLTFTLHSTNPLNYDPPIAEFDPEAETAIFESIVETFYWWG
jgi:hypothetical protein